MPRALALVRPALLRPVLTSVLTSVLAAILARAAHAQPAPRATVGGTAEPAAAPTPEARPCRLGSAPHQEATQALAALSAQIEALAPAADFRPASAALTALLAHPCLRLADLDLAEPPRFDSALVLKHFWKESGADWLQAYLDHAKPGSEGGRMVVLPAAPRPTLSRDTHPGHALAPLLCSLADAGCGARTRGWALRADDTLERSDYLSTADSDECARKARRERAPRRYTAWRACLDSKIPRNMALPLGGLNAPADGWLVIHGRRGHYDFRRPITCRAPWLPLCASSVGLCLNRASEISDSTRSRRPRPPCRDALRVQFDWLHQVGALVRARPAARIPCNCQGCESPSAPRVGLTRQKAKHLIVTWLQSSAVPEKR